MAGMSSSSDKDGFIQITRLLRYMATDGALNSSSLAPVSHFPEAGQGLHVDDADTSQGCCRNTDRTAHSTS